MLLIVSALFLIAFVANVVIGSVSGTPIVGNVAEMLLLLAASIVFVILILQREAAAKKENED